MLFAQPGLFFRNQRVDIRAANIAAVDLVQAKPQIFVQHILLLPLHVMANQVADILARREMSRFARRSI
jgi:hypothetical protein